ncbi:MAG: CRISPR-associated protein Csa1 [Archaeoglobi archaeon]|nr:CRISPR-associated protein Csa1 [Archaeoglobi archaeon]
MFLNSSEIERKLKVMRKGIENCGISEELRGYSWDGPPVEPLNDIKISISDINGFCPTRRDVYLKYVLRERAEPNHYMLSGLAYHKIIRDTLGELKKFLYSKEPSGSSIVEKFYSDTSISEKISKKFGASLDNCTMLYRYIIIQTAAKVDDVLSKFPDADADTVVSMVLPPFVERKVDGSLVGLSENLSLDLLTPFNTIMDFKSGVEREGHKLGLAGYALALESSESIEVNFGFLVYIRFGKCLHFKLRNVLIGDELRRSFIEIRDEIADLLDSGRDPGIPDSCPKFCAYYGVCHETRDC